MTTAPILVEVIRSGFRESIHAFDVAVVDERGALVASAGDAVTVAAFRSSAKPIQARVALEAGWSPADERSLAIACASHSGEPAHLEQVRAILQEAGLGEDALRTPPDVPANRDAALAVTERTRVQHNCSGKHAAMLATCATKGWPLETYRDPAHPHQVEVRALVESLTGGTGGVLVDGCGVPTFVAPLRALAGAFRAIDGGAEARAMRANPFFVGGTGRLDTDLMAAVPRVLSKGGAEGLVCMSVDGYGIALKCRDGGLRLHATSPVAVHVLALVGAVSEEELARLERHQRPAVLGGGEPVGAMRARGALERR